MKNERKKRSDCRGEDDIFMNGKMEEAGLTIWDRAEDDAMAGRWSRRVRYVASYMCCDTVVVISHEAIERRIRNRSRTCQVCGVRERNRRALNKRRMFSTVPDAQGWASPPSSKVESRMQLR